MEKVKYFEKLNGITLWLSALLLPMIPMLYLYNQNSAYINFKQLIIITLFFVFAFIVLFAALFWYMKNGASAFLMECILCLSYFAVNPIYNALNAVVTFRIRYSMLLIGIVDILLLVLIKNKKRSLKFDALTSRFLCIMIIFVFLMTVGQVMRANPKINYIEPSEKIFSLDKERSTPNVYWFHCDGMLGFDAFERYYGDDQSEFILELENRGFGLNKSAKFEANHTTQLAIPTLMSPDYYDQQLADRLSSYEKSIETRKDTNFLKFSVAYARLHNELIDAFRQKDYYIEILEEMMTFYFFPIGDINFKTNENESPIMYLKNGPNKNDLKIRLDQETYFDSLVDLLIKVMPIQNLPVQDFVHKILGKDLDRMFVSENFPQDILQRDVKQIIITEKPVDKSYGAQYARGIFSIAENQNFPKFSLIFFSFAHRPFVYEEDGTIKDGDVESMDSYYSTHKYAARVLINSIDEILKNDKDAVIVLQADHGLHGLYQKQIQEQSGYDMDGVLDIWNSVMSGIRVPDQYKTDDIKYALQDPRNMSRYLVNTFVGENYLYIQNK